MELLAQLVCVQIWCTRAINFLMYVMDGGYKVRIMIERREGVDYDKVAFWGG